MKAKARELASQNLCIQGEQSGFEEGNMGLWGWNVKHRRLEDYTVVFVWSY